MSKRRFALLVLCAVLFTTLSFAASKNSDSDRNRSGEWSVWALQNGDLPDQSLSLSGGGVGNLHLSQGGGGPVGPPIQNPGIPDNWNGGTGNWSVAGNWSGGVPNSGSDVTIYSGGNDTVTLDVSTTISSLTLGGAANGFTSELTDAGVAQTLTITNGLNVGQTGVLFFYGGSTITGDLSNAGTLQVEFGGTLNITGNVTNTNSGQILVDLLLSGNSQLNISGALNNSGLFSFYGLASAGTVGSLDNAGTVNLQYGSFLNITGDATNSGLMETQLFLFGSNQLNIGGMLTNESGGTFSLGGEGDSSTIGSLSNTGTFEVVGSKDTATIGKGVGTALTNNAGGVIDVEGGSTLTVKGDADNAWELFTSFMGGSGHNTVNITGTLTNESTGQFILSGPADMATLGSLSNAGFVNLENGSKLQVNGDVNNSGSLFTSFILASGANTINITGSLTNSGGFTLFGPVDMATVGSGTGTVLVNSGFIDLEGGSTLMINGDVNNSASGTGLGFYTSYTGTGGNTLTIGGMLTNSGTFALYGPNDTATIGTGTGTALTNNAGGFVDVDGGGSSLTVQGDVINNAGGPNGIYTSFNGPGGNTLTITGMLTNNGMVGFELGDTGTIMGNVLNNGGALIAITGGSTVTFGSALTNSGTVDLENLSSLTVMGNVDNFGNLQTSGFGGTGGNTLTISGMLTNNGTFQLGGPGDTANINNGVGTAVTNNAGAFINVDGGSTLAITGDVMNDGTIQTDPGHNTITISGMLTNEAGGEFLLNGPGDMATIGSLNNLNFLVDVEQGSKLQINGNASNSGTIATDYSGLGGGNTLIIGGNLTNSGDFFLEGAGDKATISGNVMNTLNFGLVGSGSTATIGQDLNSSFVVEVENGSTLQVNGNATNSGLLTEVNGGGNTIAINGLLTNSGTFQLNGPSDLATMSGLANNTDGFIDLENGSKLQVNGSADNAWELFTSSNGGSGHNAVNIAGTLTNESSGQFILYGPGDTATLGSLSNAGYVDLENGSKLQVNGDASNSGSLFSGFLGSGANTLNITGTLTNGGGFALFGPGDAGTIGSLINNAGGSVDVEGGSTLNITGDVTNSASGTGMGIYTSFNGTGGNTLTIGGMLTNSGTFELSGPGDKGTIGNGVTNSGILDVDGGSTLKVTGAVTNNGTFVTDNYGHGGGNTVTVTGNFTNNATFDLLGASDVMNVGGNLTNGGAAGFGLGGAGEKLNVTGNLTTDLGGGIGLNGAGGVATVGGNLANSGGIDVQNGSTLQINGDATNSGILETNMTGLGGGNTITVNGMLTNTAAGQIILNGPGDVLSALAGLSNSGVINVNNGSSILPPFFNNLGTLNIDGTSRFVVGTPTPMGGQGYIQLANGTLGEMIASLTSFGTINVTGSALLNGTLDVLLEGGYNPAAGSMYKFLNFTPGMLSGMFANIPPSGMFASDGEEWMITYDNADGFVELTAEGRAVSEPATLLVLIPGLLGVGYGLRRKLLR